MKNYDANDINANKFENDHWAYTLVWIGTNMQIGNCRMCAMFAQFKTLKSLKQNLVYINYHILYSVWWYPSILINLHLM